MHAKTNKEIIHATRYLSSKPVVAVDLVVPLHFPTFPLPSCSKSKVCPKSSKSAPRTLCVQYHERENGERAQR